MSYQAHLGKITRFFLLKIYFSSQVWPDMVEYNLIMSIVASANHLTNIFMNLKAQISRVLPGTF